MDKGSFTDDPLLMDYQGKRRYVINEKLKRCRDFKEQAFRADKSSKNYLVYRENTPKEELVLEHVIQFKKQFQHHVGENRELFLYPKN
jgi:hypothetical protein